MCPVCREPMVTFELEGVEIDRCLKCGGTWLDAGELDHLALMEKASPGKLSEALRKARGEKRGGRRCVRCPGKLRVVAVDGVEIDRCPRGHGLWFDRDEMKTLVASCKEGEEGVAARFLGEFIMGEKRKEE